MSEPVIAIIGLGYVGLPLALAFSAKYRVIGFDTNIDKIDKLCREYAQEKGTTDPKGSLSFTHDGRKMLQASIFIITVPTPVDKHKKPDLSELKAASAQVAVVLKKGDLVIYESTVYPGCTEEDCVPVLEQISGLQYNKDFFCGYSPERINVGDQVHTLEKIIKITAGSTSEAAERVDQLYASIIAAGTYRASSIKVAEAAKVIENAQRDLNISFVNELALIMDKIGIDTNEVLDAAATKWNFLNFRPGLVGGHCIGVDPYYLTHKAIQLGYTPKVILSGREVNENMPDFVAEKLQQLIITKHGSWDKPEILLLGATFKENCDDVRNSRVLDLFRILQQKGAKVTIVDPWLHPELLLSEVAACLRQTVDDEKIYDGVVLAVAHECFKNINFYQMKQKGAVLYDVKNFIDRKIVDARL